MYINRAISLLAGFGSLEWSVLTHKLFVPFSGDEMDGLTIGNIFVPYLPLNGTYTLPFKSLGKMFNVF